MFVTVFRIFNRRVGGEDFFCLCAPVRSRHRTYTDDTRKMYSNNRKRRKVWGVVFFFFFIYYARMFDRDSHGVWNKMKKIFVFPIPPPSPFHGWKFYGYVIITESTREPGIRLLKKKKNQEKNHVIIHRSTELSKERVRQLSRPKFAKTKNFRARRGNGQHATAAVFELFPIAARYN